MMTPPQPPSKPPEVKLSPVGKLAAVLIALAVIGLCAIVSFKSADQPPDGYDARAACEELVKNRLRSPASAKFSGIEHTGSGGRYVVTGAVDSQNAFGAMIRNTFTCEVRLDGDFWRLVRMDGLTR